jgi:hypothetical protein
MATHYEDREEMFEGAVVLFRRGDAVSQGEKRFWSARFKIDGLVGFKFVSLRTRNHADARAKAKSTFLQLTQAVKDGASLRNQTFGQAWHKWYETMIAHNVWTDDRKKWHRNYFNRYFQAYFGDKKLDEINEDFANEYFTWRKQYWVDGEGVNQISYNRRRKGMKNHSTNAKKEPAYTTLQMEKSCLNQFFDWCHITKRFMRYAIRMKVISSQKQKNAGRRASFDNNEWNALTKNLLSWADGKGKYAGDILTSFHKHYRQQLRFYVLFLASTGIRSGTETRFMKWSDISSYKDSDGIEHLKIRIRAETKRGVSRSVISQPDAVLWLGAWKAISHYNGDQDLVWYGSSKEGEKQKPITDLNNTFHSFLRTCDYQGRPDGLLNDPDGGRRSLYSVRHFYASQRLLQNVSYEDLRRNMGTGVAQLSRHYDHVMTEQRASEITQTKIPKLLGLQRQYVSMTRDE